MSSNPKKEDAESGTFWIEAVKKLSGPLVIALAILFVAPIFVASTKVAVILAVLASIITMFWIINWQGVQRNELILFGMALAAIVVLVLFVK